MRAARSPATSMRDREATHVGLDVHKDTISVAVLEPGSDTPAVDKIWHDEASVRRLIEQLSDRVRLRGATKRARPATSCAGG